MGKAKNIRDKKLHVVHKAIPQNQIDSTQRFDSTSRPLPQIEAPEENIMDHQFGFDPN